MRLTEFSGNVGHLPRNGRLLACLVLIALGSLSCQEKGYRTEVVSGEQGGVDVKRVPYTPPPAPPKEERVVYVQVSASAPATPSAVPPAEAAPAVDSQLREVESLWPQVSPEDRQRVTDMVKRLAAPSK